MRLTALMASDLIAQLQKEIEEYGDKPVIMLDPDTGWYFDVEYHGVTNSHKNYEIGAYGGGYGNEITREEL